MARQPSTTLALTRIETEEKTTDLKLRLKGKLAVDLADYLRAYVETNGQSVDLDQLVPHMLATFIEADRGFQTWRKSAAGKTPAAA
ncbi:MAG TPA: DUF2274 domain-containing protein [Polyangia bacterium]|jgi:hypothetical protein|nr:DUF2274 domain-containing protein [Polyangia bacterium]